MSADESSAPGSVGPEGPQPATGGWHVAEWASELVGTALLVTGGLSAVTFDFGRGSPVARLIPSMSWRFLLTGTLFGGVAGLVAVSPLGRRSGAHLNPAVTLAFWRAGHVHRHDLAGYVTAQCLGAIGGAGLLRALWGPMAESVDGGVTRPGPGVNDAAAAGIEAAMTAALVLVIFAFLSSRRTARWTPLAVWITVAVLVWRGAPLTGTSLNPARSLGPALVFHRASHLWIYLIAPPAGAMLAEGIWRLVARERRTLTAKLFHDHRYPSTMQTSLPARPPGGRGRVHPNMP